MEKKSLAILATSHFVTDLNLGSLPAVLPFFVTVYGFDYKSVAGLMFASSCLSTIVQPFFGWLADKGPRHWFMGLGLLICGISFALAGFFTNYWAIFAAILLSGVGSAIFHPEAAKLVNAISGAKRGMGIQPLDQTISWGVEDASGKLTKGASVWLQFKCVQAIDPSAEL